MSKFIVKSPIKHDGKLYQPGEKIKLTDEQAAAMPHALEPVQAEQVGSGDAQFVALKNFQYQGERFREGETYTFDSATALELGAERIRPATEN